MSWPGSQIASSSTSLPIDLQRTGLESRYPVVPDWRRREAGMMTRALQRYTTIRETLRFRRPSLQVWPRRSRYPRQSRALCRTASNWRIRRKSHRHTRVDIMRSLQHFQPHNLHPHHHRPHPQQHLHHSRFHRHHRHRLFQHRRLPDQTRAIPRQSDHKALHVRSSRSTCPRV